MYFLKLGIKQDPVRRWALPDRIFFGHGACHILAGTFLQDPPLAGFHAEKIVPPDDMAGNHIYVTDGDICFDYHGYTTRSRMLEHHAKTWSTRYPDWTCNIEVVDFNLLDTKDLNARKMLGPDQYLKDPIARAGAFIQKIDHQHASEKCRNLLSKGEIPSPLCQHG